MDLPEGTFDIGPQTGPLLLHTGREGVAAKVGHDLTITFEGWSGTLTARGADVGAASVRAEIETGSIRILTGSGGALPLTDSDRKEIGRTARRLLEVDQHPTATFASTSITRNGDRGTIEGTLSIRGESSVVQILVERNGTGWKGTVSVRQTSFGIKPYRAFFGALRLADDVRIEVQVAVTGVGTE